jgi:hypothetical protein
LNFTLIKMEKFPMFLPQAIPIQLGMNYEKN